MRQFSMKEALTFRNKLLGFNQTRREIWFLGGGRSRIFPGIFRYQQKFYVNKILTYNILRNVLASKNANKHREKYMAETQHLLLFIKFNTPCLIHIWKSMADSQHRLLFRSTRHVLFLTESPLTGKDMVLFLLKQAVYTGQILRNTILC